ncbi:MAG TPA: DUF4143 domain-containing protein, partial [Thermoanaerobaculia bacterium]|nr:DUF4143 domain-containing protein [Thermoanaerobaculia bacterium]
EDWRQLARRGGYPTPAYELNDPGARSAWFAGYTRTYLERDLQEISSIASLVDFRRLMRVACLRLGNLINQTEVARDVGISQPTVHRHLNLLETTYQVVRLPAFTVNRTKRLLKTPRLFWSDTGLALHLAGETEPRGAHLENLVLSDLLAWRDSTLDGAEILYWRTTTGEEVDFVIEHEGMLLPIEVKATRRPTVADTQALQLFRREYAGRTRAGLLLHAGSELAWLADWARAASPCVSTAVRSRSTCSRCWAPRRSSAGSFDRPSVARPARISAQTRDRAMRSKRAAPRGRDRRMTEMNRCPRRAAAARRGRPLRPAAAAALAATAACALAVAFAAGVACSRDRGSAGPAAAQSGGSGTAGVPGRAARPFPDACEVMAAEDVQEVSRDVSGSLSSTLEDAVGKDPTQCSYSLGGTPPRMISLSLRRFPSAGHAASQQQTAESGLRSISAGAPVEDLPRLGDGAFWIGGQIDQLNVRRGDTLLIFTVQIDKDPLRAARTLAAKALARLAHPAPLSRPAPPAGAPAAGSGQPPGGGAA